MRQVVQYTLVGEEEVLDIAQCVKRQSKDCKKVGREEGAQCEKSPIKHTMTSH
jgi:hypothetical protein